MNGEKYLQWQNEPMYNIKWFDINLGLKQLNAHLCVSDITNVITVVQKEVNSENCYQ